MGAHRSVNEILDSIAELRNAPVEVEGVLDVSFDVTKQRDEYWLMHYPKVERKREALETPALHRGSLWLQFGEGSIRPNAQALSKWKGKRVRVHGVAQLPSTAAADPFPDNSAYYPHLEVYSIQRVTAEQRRDEV